VLRTAKVRLRGPVPVCNGAGHRVSGMRIFNPVAIFRILIALLAISSLSCRQDGLFGCNNVLAFRLNGRVFNGSSFSSVLYRNVDYYTGLSFKTLTIEAENPQGEYFLLEITDFRDGAFGTCLTVEPYYANIFVNYCVPGQPFACNQYRAEFRDEDGNVYVQSGDTGQLIITRCDAPDANISGNFGFEVEDFSTGASGLLEAGSFSVCYLVL